MPIYKVRLKCKREIAAGTMAFYFEKPQGFAYKAGQSADCTLINPAETDAEGDTRALSLASAPYESDLMLATRMRDTAFKRVLKTMEPGTELTLDAPRGAGSGLDIVHHRSPLTTRLTVLRAPILI